MQGFFIEIANSTIKHKEEKFGTEVFYRNYFIYQILLKLSQNKDAWLQIEAWKNMKI